MLSAMRIIFLREQGTVRIIVDASSFYVGHLSEGCPSSNCSYDYASALAWGPGSREGNEEGLRASCQFKPCSVQRTCVPSGVGIGRGMGMGEIQFHIQLRIHYARAASVEP